MNPLLLKFVFNKYTIGFALLLCAFLYVKGLRESLVETRLEASQYGAQVVTLSKQYELLEKQYSISNKAVEDLSAEKGKIETVFVDKIKRIKQIEKIYVNDGSCSLGEPAIRLQHEAADAANTVSGSTDSK